MGNLYTSRVIRKVDVEGAYGMYRVSLKNIWCHVPSCENLAVLKLNFVNCRYKISCLLPPLLLFHSYFCSTLPLHNLMATPLSQYNDVTRGNFWTVKQLHFIKESRKLLQGHHVLLHFYFANLPFFASIISFLTAPNF